MSPETIAAWVPEKCGRRGGQRKYSDLAIETALTLGLLFNQPLRQAERFLNSLFRLMGVDLSAPDYTTLSSRAQCLGVKLRRMSGERCLQLIVDSTGLTIMGRASGPHRSTGVVEGVAGGSSTWDLMQRARSSPRCSRLAEWTMLQPCTGSYQVEGKIESFTADTAYDARAVYAAAQMRGTMVVIPPTKAAQVGKRRYSRVHAPTPDEVDVYAGVLSDPRLEPLAPRLRELRGRRPRCRVLERGPTAVDSAVRSPGARGPAARKNRMS